MNCNISKKNKLVLNTLYLGCDSYDPNGSTSLYKSVHVVYKSKVKKEVDNFYIWYKR